MDPIIIRDKITTHTVHFCDTVAGMRHHISENAVGLVVTSPPYFNLKDYGHIDQIGFGQTLDAYRASLINVFHECYRVLMEGRRMVINIADVHVSNKDADDPAYRGNFYTIPISTYCILDAMSVGFKYLGNILWCKTGTHNPQNGGSINTLGSYPYPPNAHISSEYEYLLMFRKKENPASQSIKPPEPWLSRSKLTQKQWQTYATQFWWLQGEHVDGHPAPYPIEIPKRCIALWSFAGELICDPFMGTGSTSRAAKDLMRNSVGFELNPEFRSIIEKRVGRDASLMSFIK